MTKGVVSVPNDISHEEAVRLFNYDPKTGVLEWSPAAPHWSLVGKRAGFVAPNGYVIVSIGPKEKRKTYRAHRLIWSWMKQAPIGKMIDHKDGDCSNNRWENLRLADRAQNLWNSKLGSRNTSGHKGVSMHKVSGLWRARFSVRGKVVYLGTWRSKEEAVAAYETAVLEHHGEFARMA